MIKLLFLLLQNLETYICIPKKTRNFQLPYFLTFYIDAYSVSKAKVVKMLYELHPTYNNISNILHSISILFVLYTYLITSVQVRLHLALNYN